MIFIGVKILILMGLIKILIQHKNPKICALIYTIIKIIFMLFKTTEILTIIIGCLIALIVSYFIFYFLLKLEQYSWKWWGLLIIFILII